MIPVIIPPYIWQRNRSEPVFSLSEVPPFSWLMTIVVVWYLCGFIAAGFELSNRYAKWPEHTHRCYMVDLHKSSRNIQIAFGPVSLIGVDHSHGWVWPLGLECNKS